MQLRRKTILTYMIILLTIAVMTGCAATDPNEEIVNDIKTNYIKSEANIAVEGDNITIEAQINKEEDNGEAYTRMLETAQEIKSKYDQKKVTIKLIKEGNNFGIIDL